MRTATKHEGRLIGDSAEARSLLWRIASMILLFNGLLVAWVLLKPSSDALVGLVVNTAEFVGPLLVLLLCFGGLLRWRRWRREASQPSVEPAVTIGQRWAPILLGLGILSWVFGQALFTFYEWALREVPPLPSRPVPVASRMRIALDGLMIMTAAVTFSWYFVLGPIMQQGNETTLAKAVSTAYPLAD